MGIIMLKVLMAASEGVPYIKTGGLADVIGALPKALFDAGVDVRVVMPLYSTIPSKIREGITFFKHTIAPVGWRSQYLGIFTEKRNGIIYYFIDNEYYFKREGLYGHYDDGERYAFFARAILDMLPQINFKADIIHCHDWQTGMVPVLLEAQYRNQEFYKDMKTVFTIHNLKFQGIFPRNMAREFFGLGPEYCTDDKLEFYGDISYMKGGLTYSNCLSTVSPTYAGEIQTPEYGERMEGLLKARNHELCGILNGIDYSEYNPAKDELIDFPFNKDNIDRKKLNKTALQTSLGLNVSEDTPLIGIVSRLTDQKGFDLIARVIDEIMDSGAQLVILGTGDKKYEEMFQRLSQWYSGRLSANILFDNSLAHKIYGASDMFLMPSLFEPCGLGQLIALRYGSIPIVRETGGLKDTVQSYNEFQGQGNGFSFTNYNAHDMLYTINRAIHFYKDKEMWNNLVQKAMDCDYSWKSSAEDYIQLYQSLLKS